MGCGSETPPLAAKLALNHVSTSSEPGQTGVHKLTLSFQAKDRTQIVLARLSTCQIPLYIFSRIRYWISSIALNLKIIYKVLTILEKCLCNSL